MIISSILARINLRFFISIVVSRDLAYFIVINILIIFCILKSIVFRFDEILFV